MYPLIRALLFRLDPELAHSLTLNAISLVGRVPIIHGILRHLYDAVDRPVQVFGLRFKNPVGLAAGYDKDARGWQGLACLGFGHIEIGTVTIKPQPGNPPPRVFRIPEQQAVINRMGFPGEGARIVAQRLSVKHPPGLVLGVNIGKNKDTPLESASQDYLELLRVFTPLADYLAINVSSPNTVGLRRLQARDMLESLLGVLAKERIVQEQRVEKKVPMLVKLAPDLCDDELDDALAAIQGAGMDGVIATNTTLNRDGIMSPIAQEVGGLSGKPLTARSREMVAKIIQRSGNRMPVIGVGGIMTSSDAQAMLDAGASLVQVYTGLIYAGPKLVQRIVKEVK
jgi:dihydroorotate dehydrogenase